MTKVKLEVEVTKELHECGLALAAIIKAASELKKEGADIVKIAQVATEVFPMIMAAVDGLENAGAEFKDAPTEAGLAIALPVLKQVALLVEKKAE